VGFVNAATAFLVEESQPLQGQPFAHKIKLKSAVTLPLGKYTNSPPIELELYI